MTRVPPVSQGQVLTGPLFSDAARALVERDEGEGVVGVHQDHKDGSLPAWRPDGHGAPSPPPPAFSQTCSSLKRHIRRPRRCACTSRIKAGFVSSARAGQAERERLHRSVPVRRRPARAQTSANIEGATSSRMERLWASVRCERPPISAAPELGTGQ